CTIAASLNGGIHALSLIHLATLPVLATWLLGRRAALWTAAVCLADMLAFAVLELTGLKVPPLYQPSPWGIWSALVQTVLICAVPVGQILQSLREAMDELRCREQAMRESEERFRRVFEEGPLGVALVGRDNRFLKANCALCQMVGYPEEALAHMTFSDITHPD